jgi:hypothetical protein
MTLTPVGVSDELSPEEHPPKLSKRFVVGVHDTEKVTSPAECCTRFSVVTGT